NLSIPDGWWDEGYLGDNGWAIGWGEQYEDIEYQDNIESQALYNLLEASVKPLFYERTADDLPRQWIGMMKRSIGTICPVFNSHRMVSDYVEKFYVDAARNSELLRQDDYRALKEMVAWKRGIARDWGGIRILDVQAPDQGNAKKGEAERVVVTVDTAGHAPEELRLEVIHGPLDLWDNFKVRHVTRLSGTAESDNGSRAVFSGEIPLNHTGLYGYVVRITPRHPNLAYARRFRYTLRG
ncbi:alpha-glucan phosphorylase, partial [Thermodesulfobacteriota bacterium]